VTPVRVKWVQAVVGKFGEVHDGFIRIGKFHGGMIPLRVLGKGRDEHGAKKGRQTGRFLDLAGSRLNNGKA